MMAAALLLAMDPIGIAPVDIADAMAAFARSVREYTAFTTPRCAPEEIEPYRRFASHRDVGFRRSLAGTPLDQIYRTAVRDERDRESAVVYECFGPPPPPGTTAASLDSRARAIAEAQKRLRASADDQPGVFDRGDALFTAMAAARDRALAGRP